MPKLTHEQFRFLYWLSLPNSFFEVSREDGFMDDKYNGLQGYAKKAGEFYKFDIRTLYALEGHELVAGEIVYHYGIAWERYSLTSKGEILATLLSVADDLND